MKINGRGNGFQGEMGDDNCQILANSHSIF
jgi:hypothetical protein